MKKILIILSLLSLCAAVVHAQGGYFNSRVEKRRLATDESGNFLFPDALRAEMERVGNLAREYRTLFEKWCSIPASNGFFPMRESIRRKQAEAEGAAVELALWVSREQVLTEPAQWRVYRAWEKEVKRELEPKSHAPKNKKRAARSAAHLSENGFRVKIFSER